MFLEVEWFEAVLLIGEGQIRERLNGEVSLYPFQILQYVKCETELNQVRNLSPCWGLCRYSLPFPSLGKKPIAFGSK
jgi:hypothetical protein